MTSFEDFEREIRNAENRVPFDIETICDYIMEVRTTFTNHGDVDGGYYRSLLVTAIYKAAPVICRYIESMEQNQSNYAAAYAQANSRKNESDKRFKFWQGVAFGVSAITIVYCMFRAYLWLSPFFPALVNWVDTLL